MPQNGTRRKTGRDPQGTAGTLGASSRSDEVERCGTIGIRAKCRLVPPPEAASGEEMKQGAISWKEHHGT